MKEGNNMIYLLSYTSSDGGKITGQRYTAEEISRVLCALEKWGATNIIIKSRKEQGHE